MKKLILVFNLLIVMGLKSQTILGVPTVFQIENQWCWAGCTNSILSYYGFNTTQCQIAEYTRTVATWHSFGSTNCCTTASLGCNYWNYNWGYAGSMEDILFFFGNITDATVSNTLSIATISTEINAGRPFIIRWGWTSGGGHFIVGKGYDVSNNIYYMNPWPGEGSKIATYNWMVSDGVHNWTHTNKLLTNPTSLGIQTIKYNPEAIEIFPNPASEKIHILTSTAFHTIELTDFTGKKIFTSDFSIEIDLKKYRISNGIYLLKLIGNNSSTVKKIMIE